MASTDLRCLGVVTDFGLSCKLYNGSVKEVTAARDVQSMFAESP